jgi:hypothetical protein
VSQQDEHARRRQLAGYYRDLFEVDARGHAVYEDLYRRFASKAKVHTAGGIDAVLRTYQDAAHREVIEHIVRMVNLANGSDESPTTEE